MPSNERPLDYVAAVALAVVAMSARLALQPILGAMQPLAHGFVAVAAAVLFCGWRPAVLTAVISYFAGSYLFLHPDGGPAVSTRQDIATMIVYGLSAGIIIFLGHRTKRAEQKLAVANQQLRAADRKKDEFLAMLSHELRNPIGVVTTAVRVLESTERDPRLRSTVAILSRQTSQIARLVDDLLDVGRITRGRLTLNRVPLDLRECVADAAAAYRDTVDGKAQTLSVSVPPEPVVVPVDQARMVQVLSNLVDNASKYSPEGAGIELALRPCDDEAIEIEVSDDGPGIPAEVLPHVFDLFDQGTPSPGSAGLGMGLGLCKRIVELHGGTIAALANPRGTGATFRIHLPRTPEPLSAPEPAASTTTSG